MDYLEITRVLVIDDDHATTEIIKVMLEPMGFEVITVHSGPEGINAARQFAPDVIVLDLLMPNVDGWQACKAIREFSTAPILVLSAVGKPELIAEALDSGADDYLLKPVTGNILTAHLNRLARRARAERTAGRGSLEIFTRPQPKPADQQSTSL